MTRYLDDCAERRYIRYIKDIESEEEEKKISPFHGVEDMEVAIVRLTLIKLMEPQTITAHSDWWTTLNHVVESQADVRADDHSLTFLDLAYCTEDNPN